MNTILQSEIDLDDETFDIIFNVACGSDHDNLGQNWEENTDLGFDTINQTINESNQNSNQFYDTSQLISFNGNADLAKEYANKLPTNMNNENESYYDNYDNNYYSFQQPMQQETFTKTSSNFYVTQQNAFTDRIDYQDYNVDTAQQYMFTNNDDNYNLNWNFVAAEQYMPVNDKSNQKDGNYNTSVTVNQINSSEKHGVENEEVNSLAPSTSQQSVFNVGNVSQASNYNTEHSNHFLISKSESKKTYIFQLPKEPRIRLLLRVPKLWEECINSGNLRKLDQLFQETLEENCVYHMLTSPAIVGRDKIYDSHCSILKHSPDFYVLFSNIKRVKKRLITLNGNSFGTLPFVESKNAAANIWNFLGTSPDKLDDFHRIQKQKYDLLRSQNKIIKFERRSVWYMILNREANKISKVMAKTAFLEVFEK